MKNILIFLIGKYQKYISPHLQHSGVNCIYNTSCSNYAVESLNTHTLPKAVLLSTYRFASCNPITAYLGQKKYKQLATLTALQEPGTEEKIKELEEEIQKLKPPKKTSKGTWGCLIIGCVLVVIFIIWSASQPSSTPSNNSGSSSPSTSQDMLLKADITTDSYGVNITNQESVTWTDCMVGLNGSCGWGFDNPPYKTHEAFDIQAGQKVSIPYSDMSTDAGTRFDTTTTDALGVSLVCFRTNHVCANGCRLSCGNLVKSKPSNQ